MKVYQANWSVILTRYYLMMGIVLASLFMGVPLLALLAVPVFLSALMGFKIKEDKKGGFIKNERLKGIHDNHASAA